MEVVNMKNYRMEYWVFFNFDSEMAMNIKTGFPSKENAEKWVAKNEIMDAVIEEWEAERVW